LVAPEAEEQDRSDQDCRQNKPDGSAATALWFPDHGAEGEGEDGKNVEPRSYRVAELQGTFADHGGLGRQKQAHSQSAETTVFQQGTLLIHTDPPFQMVPASIDAEERKKVPESRL